MIKVCFLQTERLNIEVLNTLKKMTPGREGIWKDMVGVATVKEADYCVIIDYTNQIVPPEKAIYVGAHPKSLGKAYNDFKDKTCFAKLDCEQSFGFGEWWLDADYDLLSEMGPRRKIKNLGCIVSNVNTLYNHKARLAWLKRFTDTDPQEFNLYGRIEPFTDNMKTHYRGKLDSIVNHM